jgi:hypothetical protein
MVGRRMSIRLIRPPEPLMKNLLLILAIATAPLSFGALSLPVLAAASSELGDMTNFHTIVADTLGIAQSGDLAGAEKRITDFETAWDKAAAALRPLSVDKWTRIDHAADAAIEGLRAGSPDPAAVVQSLNGLIAVLDDPNGGAGASVAAAMPATFAVSNADGSPLPCEVALETLRTAAAGRTPTDQAKYDQLLGKGLERCNADDDKRADGFFADAYALLG